MALVGLHLLILVVLEQLHSGVGRQKVCSCYTFEDGSKTKTTWTQARSWCEYYNKSLVAMETLQEWEFINKTIKNRTSGRSNEWHIGLFKNVSTGNWTWINGKRLTIDKWQKNNPERDDSYALIAKEFPLGSYGLFSSIKGKIPRGWICEEETDNCDGSCMFQYPPPTTASPTRSTITEIKESTRPPSTATPDDRTYLSDSTTLPTVPSKHILKEDKNFFTAFSAAASLAAMLFIALIAVVVVSLLWRKNQRGKGVERTHTTASNQLEEPCENTSLLNPGNAARQLGLSVEARDSGNVATRQLTAQPCIPEGGYAVLNPRTITSEGSCYEPLVPSKQEKRTSADCSETPTYVNQKAMPEYMNVSA